jgi:hypothetical protein
LPATLSRRLGQDLFLSVSPRDEGTFTYEWRKDGQAITPLSFGKQTYFKSDLKSSDSGTYSVVVKRNGTVYATNQTILTVTNTAPGPDGGDDFTVDSTRWSGIWGMDSHDSYLEVNSGQLDFVMDKAGSANTQAFRIWDHRMPSQQNWEMQIDTYIQTGFSPSGFFALRFEASAPQSLQTLQMNGLEAEFAYSPSYGGRSISTKSVGSSAGATLNPTVYPGSSTTNVSFKLSWNAASKVLSSFYDANGPLSGYSWSTSATKNYSALPAAQLSSGFSIIMDGIAEPSFLLPAGKAYFKNFSVRTGPVIPAQMAPQTAAEGGSVTFTAPGEGTGPISYQWRKNGVAIDGQTNSTLTLSGLTSTDAGQYSVFISNALGTITSSNTLLTVIVPPSFPTPATNGLRGNLGSAFRYQPMITGSAAVFTSGNLPPGLSVNRTNGLVTGTPIVAGYYRSALTASNFAGTSALRLNFTIPGSPQTLPFTDDFSRTNANRYMPLGFSGISAEARAGLTNGVLRFTCISNAQAAELFPRTFGYGEEAAFGWAANLGLSVNRPWQIEADACVPESGLFGLAIYPDSLNSTVEQALPRRLNLYWHRTPSNTRGWLATSGWTVNGAGQQEEYDSPPMGHLNSGPTSSVVKLRLVMGISGTNRLLTAWGTEDLTGRGGWSQIGQTLELNPGGTTDGSNYPLGQDWNLSTNSTFSLGLFGQFGAAGQASWVDNLRVTVAVAPVITSITNLIGQVGKASFSYSISATNSPTSFAASNLPAGLGVDSSTGLITGTPTAAGSNNVVLYASSPAGTGSRTNLAIILPEFTSATTSTGFVNDGGFSHRVAVGTNNFGSNLKYAASGLPTGMSINATSGVISGKPTVAGAFPATVTITALGASASQRIDFTIQGAAGGVFSLTLNPRPTNVLNLPVGLSYNKTTGVISGTPQGWGAFTATGQMSNGATSNISIPVMPSVPVIAGPTNWNGQVGQEIEYHIVAGGYGREWAGWDDFSSGTTKWRKTPADMENLDLWPTVNSLAVANGELNYQCKRNDRAYWTYLLWNQDLPLYANWAALAKIKASGAVTQGGPGSSVRAGFRLAKIEKPASNYIEGILNQTGGLNSAVSYSPKSPSFSSSYPRSAGEEAFLAFYHNASGRTFSYHASIPTLGSELQELETYLDSSLGLGSANVIRLGIGGLAEGSLVTSGQITFDDFVLLPDPDDIEYRAYLVNSAGVALTNGQGERYLPDGLECDPQTGSVSGTVSSGVVAGTYQIRTEAEYLTANLPIQGLPSVKGGKTVPLTLLPAFTGASSATGFLNVAGFTHQVDVGAHSFGSSLKFSATGLPTGTIINATSGLISGKPTAAGTFGTRVTITAGTATAFQDIQISVYNGEGNRWAVGSPVSYQVNLGTGVTGYQASGLPTGMTINATTGLISGTPVFAGSYNISVQARNTLGSLVQSSIQLIVDRAAPLFANTGTPQFRRTNLASYPSIFFAWNLEVVDRLTFPNTVVPAVSADIFRHDLGWVWSELELKWNDSMPGQATYLPAAEIVARRKELQGALAVKPSLIHLIELHYRDAPRRGLFLPENSQFWLRKTDGNIESGWSEGSYGRLDFSHPQFQDLLAARAKSLMDANLGDGILLDWWNENFSWPEGTAPYGRAAGQTELQARKQLLAKIRAAVGEDKLIFGNTNYDILPETGADIDGVFMECFTSDPTSFPPPADWNPTPYGPLQWQTMENALQWFSTPGNLRSTGFTCLELWARYGRTDSRDLKTMRAGLAMSLCLSDGCYVFDEPNWWKLPSGRNYVDVDDHRHSWYYQWDKSLGRPLGNPKSNKETGGYYQRQFQNGWVVYNPLSNGSSATLTFSGSLKRISTGQISASHIIDAGDGDLFVLP